MKRVVIIGSPCTGKSTLTNNLAKLYNAPFSNEFVRDYVNNIKRKICMEDLALIIDGQNNYEKFVCRKSTSLVFHDTNLLSTLIYSDYYYKTTPSSLKTLLNKNIYDLYLLCKNDIPWIDEPLQRDNPKAQSDIQERFKMYLEKNHLPYVQVCGSLQNRIDQSINSISKLQ